MIEILVFEVDKIFRKTTTIEVLTDSDNSNIGPFPAIFHSHLTDKYFVFLMRGTDGADFITIGVICSDKVMKIHKKLILMNSCETITSKS